jgi:hypothetical protein
MRRVKNPGVLAYDPRYAVRANALGAGVRCVSNGQGPEAANHSIRAPDWFAGELNVF